MALGEEINSFHVKTFYVVNLLQIIIKVFFNFFKTQCQRINGDQIVSKGKSLPTNNPFILEAGEEVRDTSIGEPKQEMEDPLGQESKRDLIIPAM